MSIASASKAQAQLAVYKAMDPEAEPGQFAARPNCNATDQAWTARASALGAISKINFETEALQDNLTNRTFAPGMRVSGGQFHVRNVKGSAIEGYNTTKTPTPGTRYIKADASTTDGTPVVYNFSFDAPIQAFSLYVTGVGNRFGGTISVSFNDGAPRSIPMTNLYNLGGAQFVGFTDPKASIKTVRLVLSGSPNQTNAARLAIDDVRWVTTRPAPASSAVPPNSRLHPTVISAWRPTRPVATPSK